MYTVRFRDKTNAAIEDRDGEDLGLMLMQTKKPDYVEINGNTIRTSEIISVTKNREFIADKPNYSQSALGGGSSCKGEKSIALELIRIATKTGSPKLLANKAWREEQTKKLKAKGKWCDAKTRECACDLVAI